jgi:hypothetical protein
MAAFELPADAHFRVRALFDYWTARRGDRPFPSRADFDPADIPRLLPYLTLVDVRQGEPRFWYRVVGTEAVRLLRRDLTGQAVGTGVKRRERREVLSRYTRVADTAACAYHRRLLQEERNDYIEIDRLMLPLGPRPGEVTQILGLITPRDAAAV